ncbi:ATP-binding protein [Acidimangrovimonas pyrenivorans]|uniref:histidine kinase n=1 Tax=Acidimangrovimonas pyrenivorans TaxID=2030798 RepID=A0ABV7AGU1_9RHOB
MQHFEPMPGGEALRGLTLHLDKEVEAAAKMAYDTGQATIAPVTLSAPGHRPVRQIMLLQPAFHHNLPDDTPELRRRALIGWAFLLVAPERIFGQDVEKEAEGASLASVAYGQTGRAPNRFETVFVHDDRHEARFHVTEFADAFKRVWRFAWQSTPWFETAIADRTAALVLYGGFLLTALTTGLIQALTDREKKVREAERRWLLAMEGSQIGVFDVDLAHRKGVTSEFWNQMIGVDSPEAALDPEAEWRARIHPDDRPGFEAAQADLLAGRSALLQHEYRLRAPNGIWHWMRDSAHVVDRDEDGRPLRLLGTMTDVTPLKEAFELAEERERELSSLIENAPVAMSVLGRDSTFLIVNDAFCAFVGHPKEALVGFKARELPNIRDIHDFDASLRAFWTGGDQSFTSELHYVRPDGAEVFGIVTASRLQPGPGQAPKIIFQVVDITERKRLERLKGDFVATVSHELRTPLTSISGSIALILGTMSDQMPDKARHMLDIAQNNAKRLGSLVNDLLDMQKLASGNITLETVQADVGTVMKEAVSETDAYAKRFGVRFELSLPEAPLAAEIDPNRFKQVMANLMSNAAKFSPEGGQIEITLEREAEGKRRYARVSVTDHGRGIPSEFRSRIFRPFSQAASSSTRDREGTGLGLVISKEIVEKMGGTIGFDSEPNVQTTFWFRFPIAAAA